MKLAVYDSSGKKSEKTVELSKELFGQDVNEALIHQSIRVFLSNQRSGSASTKTRSETRGGGTKPWRQKGTGRARAGSIRSPLWVGGGIIFGPKPKDWSLSMPKKSRKLALKMALSFKAKSSELMIIKDFKYKEPSTKKAAKLLDKLKVSGKATFVLDESEELAEKSLRNLSDVNVFYVSEINSYYVLDNDVIILSESALNKLMKEKKK